MSKELKNAFPREESFSSNMNGFKLNKIYFRSQLFDALVDDFIERKFNSKKNIKYQNTLLKEENEIKKLKHDNGLNLTLLDQLSEKNQFYKDDINKMEERLKNMQETINKYKTLIEENDSKHKNIVYEMSVLSDSKIKEMQLEMDRAIVDKNNMVLKYAKSEKDMLIWKGKHEKLQDLYTRDTKLRDLLNTKLKNTMAELNRISIKLEEKNKECNLSKKECQTQRELAHGNAVTIKWTQGKLEAEIESHKETKKQLEYTISKFENLRQELTQLNHSAQLNEPSHRMYSGDEEETTINTNINDINNNIANNYLGETLPLNSESNASNTNGEDAKNVITNGEGISNNENNDKINKITPTSSIKKCDIILNVELELLRKKHRIVLGELSNAKFKISVLEQDAVETGKKVQSLQQSLLESHKHIQSLDNKILTLEHQAVQYEKLKSDHTALQKDMMAVQDSKADCIVELSKSQERERKLLALTESTSLDNAKHIAEITIMRQKVDNLTTQNDKLCHEMETLQCDLAKIREEKLTLETEQTYTIETKEKLLNEKDKLLFEYGQSLEVLRTEIKTLKRKYTACQKDLTQHIKLLELSMTSNNQPSSQTSPALYSNDPNTPIEIIPNNQELTEEETLSIRSFSTSIGSNSATSISNWNWNTTAIERSPKTVLESNSRSSTQYSQSQQQQSEPYTPALIDETNLRLLVEKSVRLQKALVKKKEKIEFLNDHIVRLQEELHKKGRIIQTLLLTEHSGAITKDELDQQRVQKHSPYNIAAMESFPPKQNVSKGFSHNITTSANSALNVEINTKLQTLLEDSILKIIVLKEGMENLGREISKLTHENQELKASLGLIAS